MTVGYWQWAIVLVSSVVMYFISPWAKSAQDFFKASEKHESKPNFLLLTSSLVISWIFAKSIAVAASLGFSYGLVGGLAYACYYLSFLTAGLLLYKMRVKGRWGSIHDFIRTKHGRGAVQIFSVLIAFRLLNEVWSNTMVVGLFFGETGSSGYYSSILVFTFLTLAYVIKGGLKSSLFTDLIQMGLFIFLLVLIQGFLFPNLTDKITAPGFTGEFSFGQGVNLMLVALLQIFSYPFHDPVLTDRAFISEPNTTRKSFVWAAIIGFICITLFSLVGVYARIYSLEGEPIMAIGKMLGIPMMLILNFIMITSATSTLDSTFTSFSKLWVIDVLRKKLPTLRDGRLAMIGITIVGTIPVFLGVDIISATTISGTMVIGLAPVFLFWNSKAPKVAFHVSVLSGVLFGLAFTFYKIPDSWLFTDGKYADLLWVNCIGTIVCFVNFFASIVLFKWKNARQK